MSKKSIYKIGIDVATNKTGVGVFHNEKVIYAGVIVSKEDGGFFRGDKVSQDAVNIQNELGKIVLSINQQIIKDGKAVGEKRGEKQEKELQNTKVILAIEVSNHANKTLAQKLGVYAGMYAAILAVQFATIGISFIRDNLSIKFVNPKEWQLRTFGTVLDREMGKRISIDKANKLYFNGEQKLLEERIGKGHDDIADALHIANLAPVLRDNFSVGQARHKRKDTEEKNKAKISVLTTKLTNLKGQIQDKRAKFLDGIRAAKKSKYDLKTEQNKPLTDFATTAQLTRYIKYINELKSLKAEIDVINKFEIKGVTNV